MSNSEQNPPVIPPVPLQSSPTKPQNKQRSQNQGRYPSNRRTNTGQSKGGPRQQQRRNQAQDQYNKYLNLAKEAASSGDSVAAEKYYQHADHYFRVMNPTSE